jgi:DNA modification methylase
VKKLKIHPLAELLPPMTEAEYVALRDSIAAGGQTDPIVLLDGKILDGRHRYRACLELGLEPWTVEFKSSWGSPVMYVYSKAVHRNLTESQKAAAAVGLEEHFARGEGGKISTVVAGGKSRELAGTLFGVSGRYVQEAKWLRGQDRQLFDEVLSGQRTLPRAKAEVRRRHKARLLKTKAAAHPRAGEFEVRKVDCLDGLDALPRHAARLIFADSPYNIGVDYGRGEKADRLPRQKFLSWCGDWMAACYEALAPDGSFFVLINREWVIDFGDLLRTESFHLRNLIVWHETFGVYERDNFASNARYLFYCVKDPQRFVFHADAVTEPSLRQTVYGDKRAHPNGRTMGNVWQIPRLVDNAAERVPGFPTQIPLALVRRAVECCSDPGDLVVDPFNGSGTTGEACVRTGRKYLGFDINADYVAKATRRLRVAAAEVAEKGGRS